MHLLILHLVYVYNLHQRFIRIPYITGITGNRVSAPESARFSLTATQTCGLLTHFISTLCYKDSPWLFTEDHVCVGVSARPTCAHVQQRFWVTLMILTGKCSSKEVTLSET